MAPDLHAVPVVDTTLRAELETVGGPALVARLVSMFLDDAPDRLAQIDRGITAGDAVMVARAAHRIKGGAATVGALRVSTVARFVEHTAQAGELAPVPELRDLLASELDALRATT